MDYLITAAHKSLLRKGAKFCPTPRTPIDNHAAYQSFLKFQESVRWAYFFAKENNFEQQKNTFVSTPWYQRTSRAAPKASSSVEAFLESCLRDLMDPKLRRKIKDNLTMEEREALQDIIKNFPEHNLRIRKEDKGGRFVIVDGDTEDELIELDLNNPIHYKEIDNDSTEDFKEEVTNWANECLENGVITEAMFKYVTNLEDSHAANPKPLYKTQKRIRMVQ